MDNLSIDNLSLRLEAKPLRNKPDYPVVDFLNFLLENQRRYPLQLRFKRGLNRRIKRLTFRFNEEEEQVLSLGLLTRAEYTARLENIQLFLGWVATQNNFKECHAVYTECKEKHRWMVAIYEEEMSDESLYPLELERLRRKIVSFQKQIDESVRKGALFHQYLVAIYEDYQKHAQEKPSAVVMPAEDHIEVELLTILADMDISDETKEEARLTLEKYRIKQQRKAVDGKQKDENARIALKTIQQHYLKE